MYDALAQTMYAQQPQPAPQYVAQQAPQVPMVPQSAVNNLAAYQMGPTAPVAAAAPTAPDSFLHNLGKVLQDQHSAQMAQQADKATQGSSGDDQGNPYAINWNPNGGGKNSNFSQLAGKLMGSKPSAGGSNA